MFLSDRWHSLAFAGALAMEQLTTSVRETMRLLGLGRTTVNAMISDGRLKSVKLGRRRLVIIASILRLIDKNG